MNIKKIVLAMLLAPAVLMASSQTTVVGKSSSTVFSTWNTNGTLYFRIVDKQGEPTCVSAWWNRLGFNSDRFELCDRSTLEYKARFYEYARLNAQGGSNGIIVALSGSANVTNKIDLCKHGLKC